VQILQVSFYSFFAFFPKAIARSSKWRLAMSRHSMSNVVVFGASLNACEESSQWQQGIGLLSCLQLQNLQLNLNLGPETDGISKVPDRAIGEILKHTNLPGVNI